MSPADLIAMTQPGTPARAAVEAALRAGRGKSPAATNAQRLVAGGMNKTERAYAQHLDLRKLSGEVKRWAFEEITLVVTSVGTKRVRYRPDFAVWLADGRLEFHECKGFLRDDARKTFLAAAERYPEHRFLMVRRKGGRWETMMDLNGEQR